MINYEISFYIQAMVLKKCLVSFVSMQQTYKTYMWTTKHSVPIKQIPYLIILIQM
jgi:hypothetical protein